MEGRFRGRTFYSFFSWYVYVLSYVCLSCDRIDCSPPVSSVHGILKAVSGECMLLGSLSRHNKDLE